MLISLRRIHLAYGAGALLDGADFTVARGERVALVGRNGAGKSTLMGVIAGAVTPDAGTVEVTTGTRVARLEQDVPPDAYPTVRACLAAGLGAAGQALADYHALGARLAQGEDVGDAYARAHTAVDAAHAWGLDAQLQAALTRLGLADDAPFAALSGGERRQVALERTLLAAPDVLLLDEPTNHLDVRAIAALETRLRDYPGALVFVTHDRAFLRALATRIVELDRGRLSSHPGDYDAFLAAQAKAAQDEARTDALFDKHLAQEEAWIRQGIKARRTRNEGRVRALEALRVQRRARRGREGQARLQTGAVSHSGRVVFEVQHLRYAWPGTAAPVVADLGTVIERGDKVALIGPNGCGKSTLIRLLLGEIEPDAGTVRRGAGVEVAYFDQHRAALDGALSVAQTVAPDSEYVDIAGQRRHVMGYLQDFLFTPQRARTPVRALSGGERSRVALARLFTRPANLLVLDEPTNDLDVETLELLETLLTDYAGTVLLVSHDRAFVDNVATAPLAFEGDGQVREYVGGYTDWLRQRPAPEPARPAPAPATTPAPAAPARAAAPRTGLSDAQRRELRQLPARIDALEKRMADLHAARAAPGYYTRQGAALAADARALADAQAELDATYARWEALEAEQAG